MNTQDLNIVRVELVAAALGDVCDELVFVGGCAASLLIDAPSASPARVTYDVDVISHCTPRLLCAGKPVRGARLSHRD